jgi:hypothetical protein
MGGGFATIIGGGFGHNTHLGRIADFRAHDVVYSVRRPWHSVAQEILFAVRLFARSGVGLPGTSFGRPIFLFAMGVQTQLSAIKVFA